SYFISGFEGSTACAATYMHSHLMDFMIPEGKSYLANAGLALCNALLIPYQGVHFHLEKGWKLFSLCHSKAHNIIERIFSILK
ncbi:hypothetical protein K443DRAFT_25723, partial [Laccaria amethystina LaAM-08-1]